MDRKLFCAVLALSLLLLSTGAGFAGRRVALVIGNSAYRNVPQLPNPVQDAVAMADLFRKAGFDAVSLEQNVGNLDFKRALRKFEETASGADIAVIYFAGHGIEINGTNYLIPTDAKLASDRDAYDEAVGLERLVRSAEPAEQLRLIILDACRDNPFIRTMKRRRASLKRSVGSGLAHVEPVRTATLIAYASKGGSTADDGDGEHSPFTAALLKHLTVPGLDLRLAFGRVRDEVMNRTNHRQEPFVYGSLGGTNVALVALPKQPAEAAPTATAAAATTADAKADYELVNRIGSRKAWEVFLGAHRTGFYADLARAQLAKLDARTRPVEDGRTRVAALAPTAGAASGADNDVEQVAAAPPVERPASVAALGNVTATEEPATHQTTKPGKPAVNTRQLIEDAQRQLGRLGCLEGPPDGILGPATRQAVKRYLEKTRKARTTETDITPELVAALSTHTTRACPLVCGSNQIAKGDRCYAKRPAPGKPSAARMRQNNKTRKTVRTERPAPTALRPVLTSRPRFGGGAGTMVGVGF